ncbi:hypothetical protein F3Y22_tig00110577pilonHSYRG00122 [Hibiscus syriacus]|uniref:MULE transposase domain-containing protein n=1 Tax=Hibiscus syriacus TaxID=106335 RepID=A0A6A3A984_HIBSY|nr:hypothetical protein F3Y22_tig00110577pilonHSYRG00122 [Hibiscus syriacus]
MSNEGNENAGSGLIGIDGLGDEEKDFGNADLGAANNEEEGTCVGSAEVNEEDLGGENNKNDTDYLPSSDVGSYETDSDGDFVSKKTGAFQGELLTVVGRDNNNQIFPIAWAVVEVKNRETWAWFLQNLQTDLNLGDGHRFMPTPSVQPPTTRKKKHGRPSQVLLSPPNTRPSVTTKMHSSSRTTPPPPSSSSESPLMKTSNIDPKLPIKRPII